MQVTFEVFRLKVHVRCHMALYAFNESRRFEGDRQHLTRHVRDLATLLFYLSSLKCKQHLQQI